MKIRKLEIFDCNQFKNFAIDLTYPKGHAKQGQPLDKVCFIGQNGTGKTTLLNIIKELVEENEYHNEFGKFANDKYKYTEGNPICEIIVNYPFIEKDNNRVFKSRIEDEEFYFSRLGSENINNKEFDTYQNNHKTLFINIPAEMIDWDLSTKMDDPLKYIKPSNELEKEVLSEKEKLLNKKEFDFTADDPKEIWKSILIDNTEFLMEESNFKKKIADELLKENAQTDKIIQELKEWKEKNPNPFINIASKLDPILGKFNLKIKTDIDLKQPEDLYFFQIQSLGGLDIPLRGWSSGTKQIILTSAPFIKLDTWQSIVLIDEPERSLYPDTQYNIIDFYTKMAPDAQFFVATHSPIVASSFEPWEIVELKFDDKGNIMQDQYYRGERSVENYFIQPQYLRWDSILSKMFDLESEGNQTRKKKLMELSEKGLRLKELKDNGNNDASTIKKLWEEYKGIAELLDWKLEQE